MSRRVPPAGVGCLEPSDSAQRVRFGPNRGLGGYVLGRGSSYVVLAHQSPGDSCQMLPLARLLAEAGYRALAFDMAGVESSATVDSRSRLVSDDVLAAVRWCRSHGARSVELVGASMGGYAVLQAALRARPPVEAVVSLSAPAAWDDPRGRSLDISALRVPAQLWAGRQDPPFAQAGRQFARQDPRAQLHLIAGAGHGVDLIPEQFGPIRRFLDASRR